MIWLGKVGGDGSSGSCTDSRGVGKICGSGGLIGMIPLASLKFVNRVSESAGHAAGTRTCQRKVGEG